MEEYFYDEALVLYLRLRTLWILKANSIGIKFEEFANVVIEQLVLDGCGYVYRGVPVGFLQYMSAERKGEI